MANPAVAVAWRDVPRRRRSFLSRHGLPYAMLAPALGLIGGIVIYPIAYGLWLAFHDKQLMSLDATYIGLQNFRDLWADDVFRASVWRSVKWTVSGVVLVVLLGLTLAMLLNAPQVLGRRILRSLFFLPWLVPTVVTATVFSWLYNPVYGYINLGLENLGLVDTPVNFLGDPGVNLYAVIVPLVWRGYPFTMLILLAAMQSIDQALYEAAALDGAGAWRRFTSITLPSLSAPLAILTLLQTIWIFNHFDIPYQMTGGGPARSTELMSTYAYNTVFGGMEQGDGAAIATVMFGCLVILATLYIRFVVRRAEDINQ